MRIVAWVMTPQAPSEPIRSSSRLGPVALAGTSRVSMMPTGVTTWTAWVMCSIFP